MVGGVNGTRVGSCRLLDVVVGCGVACRRAVRRHRWRTVRHHEGGFGRAGSRRSLRRPRRRPPAEEPPDGAGLACAGRSPPCTPGPAAFAAASASHHLRQLQGIALRVCTAQRGYRGNREHGDAAAEAEREVSEEVGEGHGAFRRHDVPSATGKSAVYWKLTGLADGLR